MLAYYVEAKRGGANKEKERSKQIPKRTNATFGSAIIDDINRSSDSTENDSSETTTQKSMGFKVSAKSEEKSGENPESKSSSQKIILPSMASSSTVKEADLPPLPIQITDTISLLSSNPESKPLPSIFSFLHPMNNEKKIASNSLPRKTDFDFSSLSLDIKPLSMPFVEEKDGDDMFGMDSLLEKDGFDDEEIDPFTVLKPKEDAPSPQPVKKDAGMSIDQLRSKAKSKLSGLFQEVSKNETPTWFDEDLMAVDKAVKNAETVVRPTIPLPKEKAKLKSGKSKTKKVITIHGDQTILNISKLFGIPVKECIERLSEYEDSLRSKDDLVSCDAIELLAMDLDIEINVVNQYNLQPTDMLNSPHTLPSRPPVIAVMGHVDHGKTTLLDRLRQSSVAAHEAGGITQAISAFNVSLDGDNVITFIDTPGHAAFTAMRKRGATATDIVLLIIAGDDGVKEQTVECLNLIRETKLPVVVAVTKCGKKDVNKNEAIQRIGTQLLDYDVVTTQFGGDVNIIGIDSITGEGIEDLKNLLYEEGVMREIRADPKVLLLLSPSF